MRKLNLFFFMVVILFLAACQPDHEEAPKVNARTVLMYLVANNNINGNIYPNIASVEAGLKNVTTPGTFVIYWDGGNYRKTEFPSPTLFKYEVDGRGTVSKRTVIQTYSEQNSVSPVALLNVLNDVKEFCPADCYGLILGSHATGWLPADISRTRSFGDDGGSKINIPELAQVLSDAPMHFDYILMDACLMSQVEVAYELKDVADYLILSPAEVLADGFPYMNITKYLLDTNDKELNLIRAAQGYIDYYKTQSYAWGTIAVVKTSEMDALAAVTRSILAQYQANLSFFDASKLNSFQKKYGFGRFDLDRSSYDFRAFIREITGGTIPLAFEEQLSRTVVFSEYTDIYPLVNIDKETYSGIGCYIPYASFTKWNAYFKNLQWYTAAGWDQVGW